MKNTRLMDRLFSSTSEKDEELNQQVANDIEEAKKSGEVDTDELNFKHEGNGTVSILDKENGEVTMAEQASDGNYDLYPAEYNPTEQPEKFIHPEEDGVTPGNQQGAPDEKVEKHLDGQGVAESNEPGNVEETAQEGPNAEECPECGKEPCECDEDEEKKFCDSTNTVVQRIFSDQAFCERLFSEVIESEDTAKVGDLKIEKTGENEVVVTDENTGDAARVELSDDEMEVTELDSKNFTDDEADEYGEEYPEQYNQLHVVGVDPFNHVLVDSPCYDEEDAQELAQQLTEDGVDGVEVIDNFDDARDYALNLLNNLGAQHEDDIEEPQEATYSDHTIYLTRYYSDNTYFMDKMFSEACCDVDASQSKIEDALENGDEIETDTEIITPVDSKTAVIEDKDNDGEYTKVVIENDTMNATPLSKDEAVDLMKDIEVEDTDKDEDEDDDDKDDQKEYSDIWCDESETKFFSENEYMTDFMCRLFSGDADEEEIVDAIKSGDAVDNKSEIITPIDDKTAVVEDKDNGEFTIAKLDEDEDLEVKPISEEEAANLTEDIDEDNQKEYSDIWCNDAETKFFSESEYMTDYMVRLFSDEADEKEVEKAIETGEQVESGDDVITPVDENTAVIEDTENNEFTKATMDDEKLDVEPISEEEAKDLISNSDIDEFSKIDTNGDGKISLEEWKNYGKDENEFKLIDKNSDGVISEEEWKTYNSKEKAYSTGNYILDKFFADAVGASAPAPAPEDDIIQARRDPNTGELVPIDDPNAPAPDQPQMTVEAIEDKALAAVQSIQAAAAEAEATIMNAKAAPAETEQANLQEAQFSEKYYNDNDAEERIFSDSNDTLVSWLSGHDSRK